MILLIILWTSIFRKDIGLNFISKYESAGVSINNGNSCINAIKKHVVKTYNHNVTSKLVHFRENLK